MFLATSESVVAVCGLFTFPAIKNWKLYNFFFSDTTCTFQPGKPIHLEMAGGGGGQQSANEESRPIGVCGVAMGQRPVV